LPWSWRHASHIRRHSAHVIWLGDSRKLNLAALG
jgi:hypothetical protein